jgi:K319-like protein
MKHSLQTVTLPLLIAGLIFYSCKREISCEGCQTNQPTQPTTNTNQPPIAVAGSDQTITLPTDSVLLNGSASNDSDGRIIAWQWTKMSGPASFNIVNANSVQAKATDLAEGVYQFELTVMDSLGFFGKDTTTVTVIKLYANEIIFSGQVWQCWWGCWIDIPDLYSYLPAGISFRVFIKRDNSNTWEEATYGSQVGYGYWVENDGHLVVYGDNLGNDTPDIKIIY